MATKTQIRNRALRRLRVIEAGGTPTTDEITDTELAFDEVYQFLVSKQAVIWDSDEDVPAEAAQHFTTVLCAFIADEYTDEARYQRLQIEAFGRSGSEGALGELIDLARADYVPVKGEALYY